MSTIEEIKQEEAEDRTETFKRESFENWYSGLSDTELGEITRLVFDLNCSEYNQGLRNYWDIEVC